MGDTKIHWADKVWNPVTGCSKVSPGCDNCYAEKMAKRIAGRYGYPADEPFRVTVHPDRLEEPGRWKKPQRIFICSMADIFHPDVPVDFLLRVFGRMNTEKHHTFMLLTKRPENALKFCMDVGLMSSESIGVAPSGEVWPSNVWLGVTAENQEQYDKRIMVLNQFVFIAPVLFVSVEPMLGQVHLHSVTPKMWVICGGESGPHARKMDLSWAEILKNRCDDLGIPFFMKQMSGRRKDDREAIPDHINVKQFPLG